MKIKTKKIIIVLLLLTSVFINAQEAQINFIKSAKWEKVLKKAQKQGKLIFVDAYTTWCGPCKTMDKKVFTNKEVAAFFNENFVNIKIDMEKGEGIQLAKDWNIKAYPTLLYFNKMGEIVHRVVGFHKAKEFLTYSKMAIDENLMAINLQKRFDAGERGSAFMYDYLVSLRLGYHKELEKQVSKDYLSSLSNEDLLKKENWKIIKYFMQNPCTKSFQYLVNNIDEVAAVNGVEEVNNKLYGTIDEQIKKWAYWRGDKPFETEKENNLFKFLQASNYQKSPILIAKILVNRHKRSGDTDKYLAVLDHMIQFNLVSKSTDKLQYAMDVINTIKSDVAWAKALQWLNIAENEETRIEHKARILEAKSKILTKLGDKSEAELAALEAKKADKEAEKAGTKIHYIPAIKMIVGGDPENN
ncbi:hypothetical protein AB832_03415 [Flavobacteriaceae bacterium (ex Bugula neritina AB1)]|nr:hypothetical protein AB832_03415 [Flavobacteriaceae bacterium (ex Bugula neritina AB1)]